MINIFICVKREMNPTAVIPTATHTSIYIHTYTHTHIYIYTHTSREIQLLECVQVGNGKPWLLSTSLRQNSRV